MRILNILATALAIATLVACGGGGGGGSPGITIPSASAATPFTVANFATYAGPSAAAVLASSSATDGLDSLASVGQSTSSALNSGSPIKLAMWALRAAQNSGLEQAQAVSTFNEPCFSGSLSGSFNDADNNDELSRGDSISFNASSCVAQSGALPINGAFSMTVNSITLDQFEDIVSASLTVNFSNFNSAGNTLNGATTVSISNSGTSISYTNFSNTRGTAAPVIFNFTAVTNATGALSISGLITINNNTYTLSTPTPIVYGTTYPVSGILRATDAAGGRIDIVSNSLVGGSLDCDFYLPGDATRDGRISSAWSAI